MSARLGIFLTIVAVVALGLMWTTFNVGPHPSLLTNPAPGAK